MSADVEAQLDQAAAMIADASSVAVLTGAGASAESGLSTFRDPEQGLWAKYDPMELATAGAFEADPALVTKWYHWRFSKAVDVEPNAGHIAMAQIQAWLESRQRGWTLITQNVDGLHQRGGSTGVVEIHGTIMMWRCTITGAQRPLQSLPLDVFPIPSEAGGLMRPCVVWFGEQLPEDAVERSIEAAESCDVFLTIGTSGVVYPAAGFLHTAKARGAKTIEINRDETPHSPDVDLSIRGSSGSVLPALMARLADSRQ